MELSALYVVLLGGKSGQTARGATAPIDQTTKGFSGLRYDVCVISCWLTYTHTHTQVNVIAVLFYTRCETTGSEVAAEPRRRNSRHIKKKQKNKNETKLFLLPATDGRNFAIGYTHRKKKSSLTSDEMI